VTTDVELCARALTRLGLEPITSFDGSAEATVCQRQYPVVRDAYLTEQPWWFNTKMAALTRLAGTPEAVWEYRFQLPNDFLSLIEIVEPRYLEPYELEGENRLLAGVKSVTIRYNARLDESLFPAVFADALSWRLAADVCLSLTENTERLEATSRLFQEADLRLKTRSAAMQRPQRIRSFPLTAVR